MSLAGLTLRNFRLYNQATIEPGQHLNLIIGSNASGKTTLLEAIHFLSTGRSFRSVSTDGILCHGQTVLSVSGKVYQGDSPNTSLSITISPDGRSATINADQRARISDLAQLLPQLVISPDSHFEFNQHAKVRRAAVDWLLFHVEPSYFHSWSRYRRALEQRNAALKDPKQQKTRFSWDEELAIYGDLIQKQRENIITSIKSKFCEIAQNLIHNADEFDIRLDAGWRNEKGMETCLSDDRGKDLSRGYTHSGPQRNDLLISINGHAAKSEASHGQNKLLVIAFRLAAIEFLHQATGKNCCLLIDDLPAELDETRRDLFSQYIANLPIQQFITATDRSLINTKFWPDYRVFHVEHGVLKVA